MRAERILQSSRISDWIGTRNISRVPLGSFDNPALSATHLLNNGIQNNGNYWIYVGLELMEVYVDFTTFAAGPYILVMRFSTTSSYNFNNAVWTNSTGGVTTALNPNSNTDQVSRAFYTLNSTATGLSIFSNVSTHFHYYQHSLNTLRNLANGAGGALTAVSPNGGSIAANNLITNGQPQRAQGWFNGIANVATISPGSTYFRHGWSHRNPPDPAEYGYARFGWSADQDGSDSQDRAIGVGLLNNGGGPVGSFSTGCGGFDFASGAKPTCAGWLWAKN